MLESPNHTHVIRPEERPSCETEQGWLTGSASSTSTPTPSSRCSTARPGSTSWSRRRRPTSSRRSASPTTATCTGSCRSTPRAARPGVNAGHRLRGLHGPRAPRRALNTRGKVDDTGGEGEGGKKVYYHLTLLAENNTGYRNLIQLASRAFLEGYYCKPKVDWEILADHSEGVIASTGCLGGHVLQSLLNGDYEAALQKAGRLQDIFGRDNLFVELQDHGIAAQHKTNPQLISIAAKLGAPLLATNDSHYTRPEDAEAHDALLCVQTNALISQSGDSGSSSAAKATT